MKYKEFKRLINQLIENNKILGIVYTVDGVEYCDWLQPSEISTVVFNDKNIIIQKIIINQSENNIKTNH